MNQNLQILRTQAIHIAQLKSQMDNFNYDLQQQIFHHPDLLKKLETSAYSVVCVNEQNGGQIECLMILDYLDERYFQDNIWESLGALSDNSINSFNSILLNYIAFPQIKSVKHSFKKWNLKEKENKTIEEESENSEYKSQSQRNENQKQYQEKKMQTQSNENVQKSLQIQSKEDMPQNQQNSQIEIFTKILKYIFTDLVQLEQIVFFTQDDEYKDSDSLSQMLDNVNLFQDLKHFKIVTKKNICSQLLIRFAREEDQDDLAKICNEQTEMKTDVFGEYFLAEIISSKSSGKICLVAENHENKAVGFMVASNEVFYQNIMHNYQLDDHNYMTKGTYYQVYKKFKKAKRNLIKKQKEIDIQREDKIRAFYRNIHSKTFLIIQLQQFCIENQSALQSQFDAFDQMIEKNKSIGKNLLLTKFEKLFKKHEITIPNEIFAKEMDVNIETCIMTPLELLFETLQQYDLDKEYLDGKGHWDLWLQRKLDSQNKEQEAKGLVGQKKKLKRKRLNKEKEILKPEGFDPEPFKVSLQKFIDSDIKTRLQICDFFITNKKQIMQLFVKENYELKQTRDVDFEELSEFITNQLGLKIDEKLLELLPYILICFGGLEYDEILVQIVNKNKKQTKSNGNEKKLLKRFSFDELYKALDIIRELNYLHSKKDSFIEFINKKHDELFQKEEQEIMNQLSSFTEYPQFLENFQKLDEIVSEVPENVQNAICLNMFFIQNEYRNYSHQFLPHIFNYFHSRDYLICSFPFMSNETTLFQHFSYIRHKNESNFSHCLYYFHRLHLLEKFLKVKKIQKKNCKNDNIQISKNDQIYQIHICYKHCTPIHIGEAIMGQEETIQFLKDNYDIMNKLSVYNYDDKEIYCLKYFKVHYLYHKLSMDILREIMIQQSARVLISKNDSAHKAQILRFFQSLTPIKTQKLIEKQESPKKNLNFLCFNNLSQKKMVVNHRIFIIGASKSCLGLLGELLNNTKITFTNISIVSISYDWKDNFIEFKSPEFPSESNIYQSIESNVNIIYGKLHHLNRKSQKILIQRLNGEIFQLEYDTLILCTSLEEKSIYSLLYKLKNSEKKISKPQFFISINEINVEIKKKSNELVMNYLTQCQSVFFESPKYDCFFKPKNIDLVQERQFIKELSRVQESINFNSQDLDQWKNLMKKQKNWFSDLLHPTYPKSLVFYGFSLELFSTIYDFVNKWKIKPSKILIIIPKEPQFLDNIIFGSNEDHLDYAEQQIDIPQVFRFQRLWDFYEEYLLAIGIQIMKNYEIVDFNETEIVLKNKEAIQKQAPITKSRFASTMQKQESMENDNVIISNVVLIFANNFDISDEIFNTIQNNGLVYNGRLIVQSDFRTIDQNIYAVGKICEFSQRYKNSTLGKSLRMDRYNQFEIGKKFADIFMGHFLNEQNNEEPVLPEFTEPLGIATKLINDFYYYDIYYPYQGKPNLKQKLHYEICDQLENEGDYFNLGFDQNQILKNITYLGKTELNFQILQNMMGLHKSYFHHMFERLEENHFKNYLEFFQRPWAEIFYHPYFPKFKQVLNKILAKYDFNMNDLKDQEYEKLPKALIETVENETLVFLKTHQNHFTNYFFKQLLKLKIFVYNGTIHYLKIIRD